MLVILADDLTGALDCAAPFAGRGLHTEVALTVEAIAGALNRAPAVLSINLGSREVGAESARLATSVALSRLPPGMTLFKKIDSRLKGNIAAELDATPFRRALVAPAIPDFGRIVIAGRVQGFGIAEPLDVANVLGIDASRAVIPDTATQGEMHAALTVARGEGVDLFVGARGLAEALARDMTGQSTAQRALPLAGKTLFVIGSRDPITLAQVEELQHRVPLDRRTAPDGHLDDAGFLSRSVTLVQATDGQAGDTPQAVSARLAAAIVPAMTAAAGTLVLSGGATAEAVLQAMGVSGFRLLGECQPGLGLAYVNGQCIIAKSGGFGGPETLCDIARATMEKGFE